MTERCGVLFAQLERRALERGVFTSVAELKRAIDAFIKARDRYSARPFERTKTAEKIVAAVDRTKWTFQISPHEPLAIHRVHR